MDMMGYSPQKSKHGFPPRILPIRFRLAPQWWPASDRRLWWLAGRRKALQRKWPAQQAMRASGSSGSCCTTWRALLAGLQLLSQTRSSKNSYHIHLHEMSILISCENIVLELAHLGWMPSLHQAEGSVECSMTGLRCKARCIWHRLRVDLKTSLDQIAAAQEQQQCLVQQLQVSIRAWWRLERR